MLLYILGFLVLTFLVPTKVALVNKNGWWVFSIFVLLVKHLDKKYINHFYRRFSKTVSFCKRGFCNFRRWNSVNWSSEFHCLVKSVLSDKILSFFSKEHFGRNSPCLCKTWCLVFQNCFFFVYNKCSVQTNKLTTCSNSFFVFRILLKND